MNKFISNPFLSSLLGITVINNVVNNLLITIGSQSDDYEQ